MANRIQRLIIWNIFVSFRRGRMGGKIIVKLVYDDRKIN
jgi:hypothetical protein